MTYWADELGKRPVSMKHVTASHFSPHSCLLASDVIYPVGVHLLDSFPIT